MAFDGTLKFDTAIDKTGFKLGLDSLGGIAKKGMAVVTAAVGAASAAVTALGGYAVSVGKDFESSMAQVIATMGITKDTVQDGVNSYDLLKEAAASAGESTTFSASEAADALNYLALAGYDAAKAADALPAVLDLAAAGGLDLAYASDLATDAMAALGIAATGENLTRFGDEMAKTASKANTSVAQLGEAILTVGGTAKSLAGGTTELNAALGVLANRGIKGAEGGTALRNVILALSAPTDKAADAIMNLGLEVFDAAGNMRPINEIFGDLNSSLSEMNEGEKTQVLNEIFNKVDLKSAQALLAGCGAEFSDLSSEIANCDGAMSQMADTMNDTLEGDLKSLSSKAEAFGISIYEGLNEPLRELAQKGGEYISQLTDAFKEGGFDGLAESFGSVAADALTTLSGYIPKLVDMGVSLVQSLIKGISENSEQITKSVVSALHSLLTGIFEISDDMIKLGCDLALQMLQGFAEALPTILEKGAAFISSLVDTITRAIPELIPIAVEIINTLTKSLTDNLPKLVSGLFEVTYAIIEALTQPELMTSLVECAIAIISALIDGLIEAAPIVYEYMPKIIENIFSLLIELVPMLAEAGRELIKQLISGAEEVVPLLLEAIIEIGILLVDEIGRYFSEISSFAADFWTDLVTDAISYLSELPGKIGEILGKVLGTIAKWANEAIENAKQIASDFVTGAMTFFNELPGKLGVMLGKALGTVARWAVDITEKAKETASEFIGNVKEFIQQLPSMAKEYLDNMVSNVIEWADEVTEKAKETASEFIENVKEFIQQLPSMAKENFDDMVSKVREWASEITSKAKNTAREFLENIKGFIRQLPSAAKEHLDNTISKVKEWAANLKNKGKEAAENLVEKITSTLRTLPDKMADAGKNLVEGLWNGITGAGDWLKSKISDFGSGIINGFKESFGIHSPSRVMRDSVGKYLAQGIGVGFVEEMPAVRKTAVNAAEQIIPAIELVKPEIPPIGIELAKPEIPPIDIEIVKPEIPKIDIEDDFPEHRSPKAEHDALKEINVISFDKESLRALENASVTMNAGISQPSPTSEITNNYNYNTVNKGSNMGSQHITIPVSLNMDGKIIADGVADIVLDEVDKQQGITVQMKKRGIAR